MVDRSWQHASVECCIEPATAVCGDVLSSLSGGMGAVDHKWAA